MKRRFARRDQRDPKSDAEGNLAGAGAPMRGAVHDITAIMSVLAPSHLVEHCSRVAA